MSQSVLVLAVPHPLQGPNFQDYVQDIYYSNLVKGIVPQVDFIFEEAAGRGPSIAEELANKTHGPGHYLDFDPPPAERPKFGIPESLTGFFPIYPYDSVACNTTDVDGQELREAFWLQRIRETQFEKGLAIVGLAHNLSFAFRLQAAGVSVTDAYTYTPYNKLCTLKHA